MAAAADRENADPVEKARARILVADDEESMRFWLERSLARRGFEVETVANGTEALERLSARHYDLAIVDLKMPGLDGLQVLAAAQRKQVDTKLILMTAYGTIRSAVEAMRAGAFDYVTKPFEIEELALVIEQALTQRITSTRAPASDEADAEASRLLGDSQPLQAVRETIGLLRESSATVLITGESGTGKEVVAREIHRQSARSSGPFVVVPCAAIPSTLVENELFGHEPGAYSGATHSKRGLLARANGGTVFFDEVSEIEIGVQAKLLRFLQEHELTPLGAAAPVSVDVRVIAATSKDLGVAMQRGTFREDLFWRLHVVPVHLPPLRDRRDDIPVLVNAFLAKFCQEHRRPPLEIAPEALNALVGYAWPGNVRELMNAIERLVVLHGDQGRIRPEDLPSKIASSEGAPVLARSGALPYQDALQAFERDYLVGLLKRTRGNVSQAAQLAGVSRPSLHRKIQMLAIDAAEFRRQP
jgi:DNA-binding NtrC family response regulator